MPILRKTVQKEVLKIYPQSRKGINCIKTADNMLKKYHSTVGQPKHIVSDYFRYILMINFKLPRRQFDQGLSPWRNKSNSSDASPQKKNVLSNRRKGCPILNIINRQNLSNPYCTLQRQSISNLIRPRYTSSVNQKSLVQTLNLRKRPQSKQILQELPVVNFVIQGGEQSAEKSTRREKFKSSFMVKHRLSLIRKDCIDQEKKPRIVRS